MTSPVKVLSWKTASGQVASTADILQSIVVVFVVLLFIVAIIIIMNTLSMNALERTEEFGMMRGVGARKGFITRMFLAETFTLSFLFGGGGILLGVIATWIVRPLHIASRGQPDHRAHLRRRGIPALPRVLGAGHRDRGARDRHRPGRDLSRARGAEDHATEDAINRH